MSQEHLHSCYFLHNLRSVSEGFSEKSLAKRQILVSSHVTFLLFYGNKETLTSLPSCSTLIYIKFCLPFSL